MRPHVSMACNTTCVIKLLCAASGKGKADRFDDFGARDDRIIVGNGLAASGPARNGNKQLPTRTWRSGLLDLSHDLVRSRGVYRGKQANTTSDDALRRIRRAFALATRAASQIVDHDLGACSVHGRRR